MVRIDSFAAAPDRDLLQTLTQLLSRDRTEESTLLACLGEVDARRLYAPLGCSSMFVYCVQRLHLSEDVAYKRITGARLARRFRGALERLADGRLHLTGLVMLRHHLTPGNAEELFTAVAWKSKAEIKLLLAARFPQPDLPTHVRPLPSPPVPEQVARAVPAELPGLDQVTGQTCAPVPEQVVNLGAAPVPEQVPVTTRVMARAAVEPLAPKRYGLQTTIEQDTRDLLQRAQQLLGHGVAPGDVNEVLRRALTLLVQQLEKRKFAAAERPRPVGERGTSDPRHIPAHVKRAVYERDRGRCTFTGDDGHRCDAGATEYDHILPVARGGASSVDNVRLLCRVHNQLEADRVFGARFMESRRAAG